MNKTNIEQDLESVEPEKIDQCIHEWVAQVTGMQINIDVCIHCNETYAY